MALSMTITKDLPFVGMTSLPVYVRVSSVHGTKDQIEARVAWHHNDSCGDIVQQSVHFITPAMDGPNFIKQAYLHLKSLNEFSGARDC